MALVAALGVNLWVVAVALPLALAAHARALGDVSMPTVAVVSLAPLVALTAGVLSRSVSGRTLALLVGFPVLVVVPQALATLGPSGGAGGAERSELIEVTARVVPAAAWLLAAASLVGYLIVVMQSEVRAERGSAGPAAPLAVTRPLPRDEVPSRWRRRLRVYRGMVAVAILFPAALLFAVDLWPSFTASLLASFGTQAPRAQAFATVGVALLWVGILRAYLLHPLNAHLQHDRDLLATMEQDRRHARAGRPRISFYVAVAVALAAMVAVVVQRSR
jgi:hypothetical protein